MCPTGPDGAHLNFARWPRRPVVPRTAGATLAASRRRPRGVTPNGHGASAGRCEPRRIGRREGRSRAVREAPDSAPPRTPRTGQPARDVEPAGGTTTPFVRWTSGACCSEEPEPDRMTEPTTTTPTARDGPAQGVRPERGRGPGLRALACRGRLPAGRSRLDRRSAPAAVHDHPAAAERDRVAPSRPRPADGRRGPDDPARADARAPDAVPARSRPRVDRGAVRARRHPRQGGRKPRVARSRALSRADARVLGLDKAGDARAAATRRGFGRLGPPPVHDGRGLGEGRPGRLRAAVPRRPGVPHRGAHQLVPGVSDERQRPRGHPDPGDGNAVVRPLPPDRRGDRAAGPERVDHGRHDAARDDPRRHRGRGAPRR